MTISKHKTYLSGNSRLSCFNFLTLSSIICFSVGFIFSVIAIVFFFFFLFVFVAVLRGMQDFSFSTRDHTHASCSGSTESQPGDYQESPIFHHF